MDFVSFLCLFYLLCVIYLFFRRVWQGKFWLLKRKVKDDLLYIVWVILCTYVHPVKILRICTVLVKCVCVCEWVAQQIIKTDSSANIISKNQFHHADFLYIAKILVYSLSCLFNFQFSFVSTTSSTSLFHFSFLLPHSSFLLFYFLFHFIF